MSENTMTPFLRQGIGRYEDACATLAHFQIELENVMVGVLKKRNEWGVLELPGKGAFKPGRSMSVRTPPHWIEATAQGKVDQTHTTIELGVWWGLPEAKCPIIVFAAFCVGSPDLVCFKCHPPRNGRFRTFAYAGRTHVALPIDVASDVASCAAEVLDEILRMSGVVSESRRTRK